MAKYREDGGDKYDEIDGRTRKLSPRDAVKLAHMEGIVRTQQMWLDEELVRLA
jgi:hypothetical protein